jgi:quinol-cytochrome oxidoreductase complex cytochrome b subunit
MEVAFGIFGVALGLCVYALAFIGGRQLWQQRQLARVPVSSTPVNVEED